MGTKISHIFCIFGMALLNISLHILNFNFLVQIFLRLVQILLWACKTLLMGTKISQIFCIFGMVQQNILIHLLNFSFLARIFLQVVQILLWACAMIVRHKECWYGRAKITTYPYITGTIWIGFTFSKGYHLKSHAMALSFWLQADMY